MHCEFDVSRDADVSAEQTHDEDEWAVEISEDDGAVRLVGKGAELIALLERALDVLKDERAKPREEPTYTVVCGRVVFKDDDEGITGSDPDPRWLEGIDLSVLDAK